MDGLSHDHSNRCNHPTLFELALRDPWSQWVAVSCGSSRINIDRAARRRHRDFVIFDLLLYGYEDARGIRLG